MPQNPDFDCTNQIVNPGDARPPEMVCRRAITQEPPFPNSAEYRGRLIVFCTRYCLEAFQADPERFYAAHSLKKRP